MDAIPGDVEKLFSSYLKLEHINKKLFTNEIIMALKEEEIDLFYQAIYDENRIIVKDERKENEDEDDRSVKELAETILGLEMDKRKIFITLFISRMKKREADFVMELLNNRHNKEAAKSKEKLYIKVKDEKYVKQEGDGDVDVSKYLEVCHEDIKLKRRKARQKKMKDYFCNVCGKTLRYTYENQLLQHLKSHDENDLTCDICQKTFETNKILYEHKMTHTPEDELTCDICQKTFANKRNLQEHKKIHAGNREFKFVCSECNKAFYKEYSLKVHMRTHTGEKPFPCDECAKKFSEKDKLKKHKMVHSGTRARTFLCDLCPKSFYQNSNLTAHKRTHTGERPFSCDQCGKAFTELGNMKKHQLKAHESFVHPSQMEHNVYSNMTHHGMYHQATHQDSKPLDWSRP